LRIEVIEYSFSINSLHTNSGLRASVNTEPERKTPVIPAFLQTLRALSGIQGKKEFERGKDAVG
jgi:hypothetical protein